MATSNGASDRELHKRVCPPQGSSKRVKTTPAVPDSAEPVEEDRRLPTRRKGKGKGRTKANLSKRDTSRKHVSFDEASSSSTNGSSFGLFDTRRQDSAHSGLDGLPSQLNSRPSAETTNPFYFTPPTIIPMMDTSHTTAGLVDSETSSSTTNMSSSSNPASSASSNTAISSSSRGSSFSIAAILDHFMGNGTPSTSEPHISSFIGLNPSLSDPTGTGETPPNAGTTQPSLDASENTTPANPFTGFHFIATPPRMDATPRPSNSSSLGVGNTFFRFATPPRMDATPQSSNDTPSSLGTYLRFGPSLNNPADFQVVGTPRSTETSSRPSVVFSDSPIVISDSPVRVDSPEGPPSPPSLSTAFHRVRMHHHFRSLRNAHQQAPQNDDYSSGLGRPNIVTDENDRNVPRLPESQQPSESSSSPSVTFSFYHNRRPSRRRDNVRITMRSPSGNDGDTAVSEVIVLSSDEEDEDTESNQQASDEELAHRIQMRYNLELAHQQEVPVIRTHRSNPSSSSRDPDHSSWPFPPPPPFSQFPPSNPISAVINHHLTSRHHRRSHFSIEVGMRPLIVYNTIMGSNLDYEALLDLEDRLGPAFPRGLSKKTLESLPVRKFSDAACSSSENNCVVCMSDFAKEESIKTLPCSHEYHVECIDPWLSCHKTCPICRTSLQDIPS